MERSNSTNDPSVEGGGLLDRVKAGAATQLSSQKDRATEGLGSIATAVRESSRPLRDGKHDTIADYVEKAADQLERYSTRLRERDVNELVHDAKLFARRRPALFVGAAFAAGVVAARFLKSSTNDEESGARLRYDADRERDGRTAGSSRPGGAPYSGGGL